MEDGIPKAVWPHSGHYRPTQTNFREFMNYLKKMNVDLTNVKLSPSEGEEDEWLRLRSGLSQLDLTENSKPDKQEDTKSQPPRADEDKAIANATPATPPSTSGEAASTAAGSPVMKRSSSGNRQQRKRPPRLTVNKGRLAQGAGAFGDRLDFSKENLFRDGEEGEDEEVVVPQEKILHRINCKMATNSYQLGKQLSFRWTTGAGPWIGCVRDYPLELQFRALEQVSLSPRGSAGPARFGTPRQSPTRAPLASRTPKGLVLGGALYATAGASTSRLQHGAA